MIRIGVIGKPPGKLPVALTHGLVLDARMVLLDLESILSSKTINDLVSAYRACGFSGSVKDVLAAARKDFHVHAQNRALSITEAPLELKPEVVSRADCDFHVYGVIHGLLGGDSQNYLNLVNRTTADASHVLFENGLQHFYRSKAHTVIADFSVLGIAGAVAVGVHVVMSLPILIIELFQECFKRTRNRSAQDGFLFDSRYHAVEPEIRRGLDENPPLPAALEIEYALERWNRNSLAARIWDPFSLVPRSIFMAGFATGFAQRNTTRPVILVVGDLHVMEIVHVLRQSSLDQHELFRQGYRFGRKKGRRAMLSFIWAKTVFLSTAGLSGSIILLMLGFLLYQLF